MKPLPHGGPPGLQSGVFVLEDADLDPKRHGSVPA